MYDSNSGTVKYKDMTLTERFLEYVSFDTQSDMNTGLTPSTPGQMFFARYLVDELKRIGLSEVQVDDNDYLTATLPANNGGEGPVVGFIAHLDTSPDFSGKTLSRKSSKITMGATLPW